MDSLSLSGLRTARRFRPTGAGLLPLLFLTTCSVSHANRWERKKPKK